MQKLPLRLSVLAALALVSTLLLPDSLSATTTTRAPQSDRPDASTVDADKDGQQIARRRKRRKRRVTPKPPAETTPEAKPQPSAAPITTSRGRPSRVEFDERLIRGQTNKADAIYLFERRSSEMRTLVKKRKHFHREIDETLKK